MNVAGALSSIAAHAAERDFKFHTQDAEQTLAVPKGPWVLDQVILADLPNYWAQTWSQVLDSRHSEGSLQLLPDDLDEDTSIWRVRAALSV